MLSFRLQLILVATVLSLINIIILIVASKSSYIAQRRYGRILNLLILMPPILFFIATLWQDLFILLVIGVILLVLTIRFININNSNLILASTLLYTLVPVGVYLKIGRSLPTVEEGRYFGFADYIALWGRWEPYKLFDNDYYQQFHTAPFLAYVTRYVLGLDLFSSRIFWGALITIVFILFIAVIAKHIINEKIEVPLDKPLLILVFASMLAVITPELYYVYITFSNSVIGVILFITSLYIISLLFEGKIIGNRLVFSLFILISIVGVFTHPLYFVFLSLFLTILVFFKRRLKDYLIVLIVLNVLYWIYTAVLKSMLIRTILNYISVITSLLLGSNRMISHYISWYEAIKNSLFLTIAWSLSVSIVIAILVVHLLKERFKVKKVLLKHYIAISALTITIIGISYAIVTGSNLTGLGITHLYTLFALYVPYASAVIYAYTRSKKIIVFLIGLIILALASYGIQDEPRYNVKLGVLGISKEYEWDTGVSLKDFLNNDTFIISDLRLSSPILYVYSKIRHISILYETQYGPPKYTDLVILTGSDEAGTISLMKTLSRMNLYNITQSLSIYELIRAQDLVVNNGFYYGVHIKVNK